MNPFPASHSVPTQEKAGLWVFPHFTHRRPGATKPFHEHKNLVCYPSDPSAQWPSSEHGPRAAGRDPRAVPASPAAPTRMDEGVGRGKLWKTRALAPTSMKAERAAPHPWPGRLEGPGVQPRAPRARAPHPDPGPPRPPRRELTPVPLSHTTTFLPWLSIVRLGESRCCPGQPTASTHCSRRPALSSSSSASRQPLLGCNSLALPEVATGPAPPRPGRPRPARHSTDGQRGKGGDGKEAELTAERSNKKRRSAEAPPSAAAPVPPSRSPPKQVTLPVWFPALRRAITVDAR